MNGMFGSPFFWTSFPIDCLTYVKRIVVLSSLIYSILDYVLLDGRPFASPRYGTEEDHCREPIDGCFWGHPKVLALDEGILFNRIMFCDHIYETEDEMRRDMIEPAGIDFTGFFSDVFGDG